MVFGEKAYQGRSCHPARSTPTNTCYCFNLSGWHKRSHIFVFIVCRGYLITEKHRIDLLQEFISTQSDREYHFWERRSRTIDIASRKIAEQKLDYIHQNPLQEKWKLAEQPEDYFYSSAKFYLKNKNDFSFLTHYMDYI